MADRRRMPETREGRTHKFSVGGHEGYITVGLFEDGTPGEVFLVISKAGSVVHGFAGAFAVMVSMALQHGIPISTLCEKFKDTRFEPMGYTASESIPNAESIVDYVFRWLELKFVAKEKT